MCDTQRLLDNNRDWARAISERDPDFFPRLSRQQAPHYLWIGCSDSRVPANEIVGLQPGEVFVHRNVANLVVHSDLNLLSVLQYAIDMLKVRHIIVCGHYGCGGVRAAMEGREHGLIDNWLRNIKDTYCSHREDIETRTDVEARVDRLCELNVATQVRNVVATTIVQSAWSRGQPLTVHGWVYSLHDGLIRNLNCDVDSLDQIEPLYRIVEPR
ncbi:MAG TPA: carbonate dehydratase [Gammaproteobacteria bacterium]